MLMQLAYRHMMGHMTSTVNPVRRMREKIGFSEGYLAACPPAKGCTRKNCSTKARGAFSRKETPTCRNSSPLKRPITRYLLKIAMVVAMKNTPMQVKITR